MRCTAPDARPSVSSLPMAELVREVALYRLNRKVAPRHTAYRLPQAKFPLY